MKLSEMLKGLKLGIRISADDENYSVNDTCRYSYDWDFDTDCSTYGTDNPIKVNGTCAVSVEIEDLEDKTDKEIMNELSKISHNYCGEQTILIGGYESEYGNDENEVIILDATVLMVL